MNVNLHIERLVLHGIEFAPGQSGRLQEDLASELMNMFLRPGVRPSLGHPRRSRAVRGTSVSLAVEANPLASPLANAICAGLSQSRFGLGLTHGGQP